MAKKLPVITWQSRLIDPETGRPTTLFLQWFDTLALSGLFDVDVTNLVDGQVLRWSEAQQKWLPS